MKTHSEIMSLIESTIPSKTVIKVTKELKDHAYTVKKLFSLPAMQKLIKDAEMHPEATKRAGSALHTMLNGNAETIELKSVHTFLTMLGKDQRLWSEVNNFLSSNDTVKEVAAETFPAINDILFKVGTKDIDESRNARDYAKQKDASDLRQFRMVASVAILISLGVLATVKGTEGIEFLSKHVNTPAISMGNLVFTNGGSFDLTSGRIVDFDERTKSSLTFAVGNIQRLKTWTETEGKAFFDKWDKLHQKYDISYAEKPDDEKLQIFKDEAIAKLKEQR